MQLLERKGTVIQATSWMSPEDVCCHKTTILQDCTYLRFQEQSDSETESRMGLPRAGDTGRGELRLINAKCQFGRMKISRDGGKG